MYKSGYRRHAGEKVRQDREYILNDQSHDLKIEEADIIVAVGRGLKKKEDIKLIESLAYTIGGAFGCSRSIAADLKWLTEEHRVGL